MDSYLSKVFKDIFGRICGRREHHEMGGQSLILKIFQKWPGAPFLPPCSRRALSASAARGSCRSRPRPDPDGRVELEQHRPVRPLPRPSPLSPARRPFLLPSLHPQFFFLPAAIAARRHCSPAFRHLAALRFVPSRPPLRHQLPHAVPVLPRPCSRCAGPPSVSAAAGLRAVGHLHVAGHLSTLSARYEPTVSFLSRRWYSCALLPSRAWLRRSARPVAAGHGATAAAAPPSGHSFPFPKSVPCVPRSGERHPPPAAAPRSLSSPERPRRLRLAPSPRPRAAGHGRCATAFRGARVACAPSPRAQARLGHAGQAVAGRNTPPARACRRPRGRFEFRGLDCDLELRSRVLSVKLRDLSVRRQIFPRA
jgi:hypothetical protein